LGRPALTDDQRSATRRRIRTAAIDLYREGGFPAVSMRAVAARAGLSASALYGYYASREELVRALWYEPVARAVMEAREIAKSEPDPVTRIERLLENYFRLAEKNPEITRFSLLHVRPVTAEKPKPQPPDVQDFYRLLREAIEEAQTSGAFIQGDAALVAQSLWAAVHGVIGLPVNLDMYRFARGRVLLAETIGLMLDGLRPRRSTS
jgi:AcrR family transcriptional regulator